MTVRRRKSRQNCKDCGKAGKTGASGLCVECFTADLHERTNPMSFDMPPDEPIDREEYEAWEREQALQPAPAEPSVVSDAVPVPTVPAGVEELKRAVVRLTEEVEDLANGLLTATNGYDQAMGRGWMRLAEPVRAALAQLEPAPNQENAG